MSQGKLVLKVKGRDMKPIEAEVRGLKALKLVGRRLVSPVAEAIWHPPCGQSKPTYRADNGLWFWSLPVRRHWLRVISPHLYDPQAVVAVVKAVPPEQNQQLVWGQHPEPIVVDFAGGDVLTYRNAVAVAKAVRLLAIVVHRDAPVNKQELADLYNVPVVTVRGGTRGMIEVTSADIKVYAKLERHGTDVAVKGLIAPTYVAYFWNSPPKFFRSRDWKHTPHSAKRMQHLVSAIIRHVADTAK
ncbi:MAG: hypothetical protein KatS3mg087_2122 [Patescibacteria group bacterium]|nr:MAG: hypothetical protein KatS3mg087_2122 [Patescibacteria group bacterium]